MVEACTEPGEALAYAVVFLCCTLVLQKLKSTSLCLRDSLQRASPLHAAGPV